VSNSLIPFPLINLWNKRSLLSHFALLNLKIRFKNSYLGFLWAAIEPLLYFIILYVVFTSIRSMGDDFAIYLISGILVYHIFTRGTSGGVGSLTSNGGIIKSMNIRIEFFPVVATLAVGMLAFVDIGVFFGLMPIFSFVPGMTILLLPVILILLLFLILGLSYLLSIANAFARDVSLVWNIFSHTLLFVSPIFWRLDEAAEILLIIQKINPLGQLIELSHNVVIDKQIPPLNDWLYTSAYIFVIFFVGYFVFRKFEDRVTEEL